MSCPQSALYVGAVTHHRTRPRRHSLRYSLYSIFVDLGELDGIASKLRLFSRNRFNLFSFYDADYGDGSATPLRDQVGKILADNGIAADGPVRLFAMPRVLGYAFNPISLYFCHREDLSLAAIIYEVHNTFGERHSYLVGVQMLDGAIRQSVQKSFHVSPFMDMKMSYRFRVALPGENFRLTIIGDDSEGVLIVAKQSAKRLEFTDANLLHLFVTHPLLTLKVVGAIHWEALRLWLKGIRIRSTPPAPTDLVTTGSNEPALER